MGARAASGGRRAAGGVRLNPEASSGATDVVHEARSEEARIARGGGRGGGGRIFNRERLLDLRHALQSPHVGRRYGAAHRLGQMAALQFGPSAGAGAAGVGVERGVPA